MPASTHQLIDVVQALDPRAAPDDVLLRLCRFARGTIGAAGVLVARPHASGVHEVRAADIAPGGNILMRSLFEAGYARLDPDEPEHEHLHDEHRVLVMRAPEDKAGHIVVFWFVDEDDDDADSDRSLTPAQRDVVDMVVALVGARLDQSGRVEAGQRRAVRRERDRIARDLHDVVVQQIFGAGLQLQRTLTSLEPDVRAETKEVVDKLDRVIRDVRTVIFELERSESVGVRDSLRNLMIEYTGVLGFVPGLRTEGDLDQLDAVVGDHMLATVRELLSNVAKHSEAGWVRVFVVHADGELSVDVQDDGVGVSDEAWRDGHRSGLGNLRLRAQLLRGTLEVSDRRPRGTSVRWQVCSTKG